MTRPSVRTISLLDVDPDLTEHVDPAELAAARSRAVAAAAVLPAGQWDPRHAIDGSSGHLGLLVVDGLLVRRVTLLGRTTIELMGAGDLLRPWDEEERQVSIPQTVSWTVQRRTLVAVLDHRFAERVAPWPGITAALVSRALSRAQWLSAHLAILENPRVDARLLLLMWHFADRWGTVEPDGVAVPLPLTHSMLGRLVRAQRPTVTARVNELAAQRLLTRRPDGGWMLHGDPRRQFRHLIDP